LWIYKNSVRTTGVDGRLVANASANAIDDTDIPLVIQGPMTVVWATQDIGKAMMFRAERRN